MLANPFMPELLNYFLIYESSIKVGRSKQSLVLTGGFNWLKPPRSICQKVVNTSQYESEWSIENFEWSF